MPFGKMTNLETQPPSLYQDRCSY